MESGGIWPSGWQVLLSVINIHLTCKTPNQPQPGFSCAVYSISRVTFVQGYSIRNIIRQSQGKSYLPAQDEGGRLKVEG